MKMRFPAYINPIDFTDVKFKSIDFSIENIPIDNLLNYLCSFGVKSDKNSIISRYEEITSNSKPYNLAPDENHIMKKIIWPVKDAKSSYMLGNFLGTIALVGFVAEMLAIFIFQMNNVVNNNRPISKKNEIALLGHTFEKLGQLKRILKLYEFKYIDEQTQNHFNIICKKRRQYLHLFSKDQYNISKDAITCYNSIINIIISTFGHKFQNGEIILNPIFFQ